jgi:DNA polymerase-1
MADTKKKFIIIDAMALAYRAYFAFISRPLQTASGEPTSAVYGFVTSMIKILEDTKPDNVAVAFDSKEKTFRHDMYDKYKSTRAKMPEDMIPQLGRIKEIIEALKFPLYILPGYEADDIIGAAVKIAEKEGYESYAVTPDKDYIQLVTKNIKIVKPGKSSEDIVIVDEEKVKEDYGFDPIQMIDYLALVGDSSDDIPGVAGVGPKTATPLIQQFGSIEGIYENIESIEKKGLKNKLIENKENAFLSKKLATIVSEVPMEIDLVHTKMEDPDLDSVRKIFTELEFKNLITRYEKLFGEESSKVITEIEEEDKGLNKDEQKYNLIKNEKDAESLAAKLKKSKLFVFDTETDSLDVLTVNLAGVAFSIKPGEAFYVAINPFIEKQDLFSVDLSDRLNINQFIKIFKDVFEDPKIKKVCQNGKYDIAVLRRYEINLKNFYFDTMLASYILDPDQKHGMDALSEAHLNHKPIPLSSLLGDKKDASKIFDVDIEKLSEYSCEDADITYRLYDTFKEQLKNNNLERVSYEIEFPLVPVLEDMERQGVRLDVDGLKAFSKDLEILLDNYTSEIYKLADESFNINSPKQMQVILFDKLNLTPGKKTKTGFSTDARALESLRGQHEIIDIILNYRQVSKLKSTYADSLPTLIHKNTGRIHTTFNQTVASTGRLSSLNPNLQNIPIRTDLGKEIRKAFIPRDKNHLILSADYSQIELRMMASICGDKALMSAFKNDEDIHRATAALVFMVDPEEVNADMRRKAKEVNFGILYGIGAFGLKNRLGITQSHAKEIIDNYFNTFKSVKSYMDNSVNDAKEKGFAETLTGRRRFLKNINSSNRVVRQFEERVAINMPIQGTAADMIKIAMINIYNKLSELKTRTKMVLQVHDELLFDIHKDEVDELQPLIVEMMESAFPLNVPVKVESGIGKNWLEAH